MPLPKIDTPIYDLTLPLSNKKIRYRPFLVKEQKNLLMAIESDDQESIQENIKQILRNCTLTEDIDIDDLPVIDIEYYFINLRAKSVGEVIENKYRCEAIVDDKKCNNVMETTINLLDIKVDGLVKDNDVIQLNDKISVKMRYPKFSVLKSVKDMNKMADIAMKMVAESIEYIYDGEQFYYSREATEKELLEFVESLNQKQFEKIEKFFDSLPKLQRKVQMTCSKCGFQHNFDIEGLENFFG
jgi:hypothetical protein